MKVLLINRPDAYSRLGGDTIQMVKTGESLGKLGINVEIAIGPQSIKLYEKFDIVHIFNLQTYDFSLQEALKVKKIAKPLVLSPIFWDFMDFQNVIEESSLWSTRISKLRKFTNISYYIKIKESYWKLYKSPIMKQKIFKLIQISDILMPNSFEEINNLLKYFNFRKQFNYQVVHNAVDTKFFNPDRALAFPQKLKNLGLKSKNYVLQVGRIEPCKNQLSLIKSVIDLKLPLILIGAELDKDYVKECKRIAQGYPIYFLGQILYEELPSYYYHAKVHALPSWRETPGLASLEAATMRCNVVSTNIGSAKEYFQEQAWYCNPFDLASIKNAVSDAYYAEPKNYNIIYSWDQAGIQTLNGYNKLLQKRINYEV